MSNPIEIAVDTNVLLDLANGDGLVIDCLETIRKRIKNIRVVVLPTVILELAELADNGDTEQARLLATAALRNIRKWGFLPVNCIPVGHGIVEETGRKLRKNGLIPEDEIHDSFIVAEAGLRGVSILLSSDHHIKDIDQNSLKILLDGCDVSCPLIASPWKIVNEFFLKKD